MSRPVPATLPVDEPAERLAALERWEWQVAVDAYRHARRLAEAGWAVGDDDLDVYAAWLAGRVEEAARFGWALALLVAEGGRDG